MSQTPSFLRYTVLGIVVLAAIVAIGSWLVRTRKVSPFSAIGRALRAVTDPIIVVGAKEAYEARCRSCHEVPRRIPETSRATSGFPAGTTRPYSMSLAGPRQTFALIIDLAYKILFAALIVRVIAAWFGMYRYSKWIRPAYILTDWLVEPLRRIIPPVGGWDLTPIVAVFLLAILRQRLLAPLLS